jgi:DNA-binding CsgD family transcriptional regulator
MYSNQEEVFGGTGQLLSLIETIYSAVGQPSLWSAVLEGIAEAVNGESTILFASYPDNQFAAIFRMDPGAWDAYLTYYGSINPLSQPCDEMFPVGTVRYGHLAMPDSDLVGTEFYSDFFRPNNMHYSIGIKVPLGALPPTYISCQRPRSKGAFHEREGVVFETLLPHLQRALMLHSQFARMQATVLGLDAALDAFGHAVFGLDHHGRVIFANRQAEKMVRSGDAIRVFDKKLCAVIHEENRKLQLVVSDVLAHGTGISNHSGIHLLIARRSRESSLRVTATPFRSQLPGTSTQLVALVFVSDAADRPQSRGQALRALYALSPTESRVADLLLQGLEVKEVANAIGITLETARFHTKRVLAKTGTRRQAELMRLMLSLPQI